MGAIAAMVWIVGCASVTSPERAPIDVGHKTEWSVEVTAAGTVAPDWWSGFGDEQLNALIDAAIQDNPDVQVLARRADAAQAQIGQARAALLPVFAAGTRTDTTRTFGSPEFNTTQYGTGSDFNWEIDIWGKARKGVEAQSAAYAASEADRRAGLLSVVSDVATAYFQIRRIDEQLVAQQAAIERNSKILGIYEALHRQGIGSDTQVRQQSAEISRLRVIVEDLLESRALTVNGLAYLVGEAAGDLRVPDTHERASIEPIPVPAGLPSDLLKRRPDIIAAERQLEQAVKLDDQSRLAQLPTIGLSGVGGTAAFGLSDLVRTWTLGISSFVRFPVFDPNVRAQIRVSEAQIGIAEAQYRATVMRAFVEVENALTSLASAKRAQVELLERERQLEIAANQLKNKLELGFISNLEVLEGQRTLIDSQQATLANRWEVLTGTVALFKAVGGGWPTDDLRSPTAGSSS